MSEDKVFLDPETVALTLSFFAISRGDVSHDVRLRAALAAAAIVAAVSGVSRDRFLELAGYAQERALDSAERQGTTPTNRPN